MAQVKAYLQITMKIENEKRAQAAKVYEDYREPFLTTIQGALTKDLLLREEDVQVLHGFDSTENANAYLQSTLFTADVFEGLKDLWTENPDVRIYSL